jgi:hypothetical protein
MITGCGRGASIGNIPGLRFLLSCDLLDSDLSYGWGGEEQGTLLTRRLVVGIVASERESIGNLVHRSFSSM